MYTHKPTQASSPRSVRCACELFRRWGEQEAAVWAGAETAGDPAANCKDMVAPLLRSPLLSSPLLSSTKTSVHSS